jgi:hypothetical protein
MGVRVVVHRISMAMLVAVDDDLTGRIAFTAIAGVDFAGSPAFDAFLHTMGDRFHCHRELLCCRCRATARPDAAQALESLSAE